MIKRIKQGFLLGLSVIFLTACATAPPSPPPPVEERGSDAPFSSDIKPVPVEPSQRYEKPMPVPTQSPAVISLVKRADTETESGRLENASALLERALRINNRDANLWYRLARVRFAQGEYLQATHLLRRSNDYARNNTAQLRLNWQLLAKIHASRGDEMSLIEAQRKLRELE